MELIKVCDYFEYIKIKKTIYDISKHKLIINIENNNFDLSKQCHNSSSLFNYEFVTNEIFNEYVEKTTNEINNSYLVHHTHPGQGNPGHILERTLADLILLHSNDDIEKIIAIDYKSEMFKSFYNIMKLSYYNYKNNVEIIPFVFPESKNKFLLLTDVIIRYKNLNFLWYLHKNYIKYFTEPNIKILKLLQNVVFKYINFENKNTVVKNKLLIFHPLENAYTKKAGRIITNVDKIKDLLNDKGYDVTIYTCKSFEKQNIIEQIEYLQSFEYFISPFGTSFVTSLFCPYLKNICLVPYKYRPLDFWDIMFCAMRNELNIDVCYFECQAVKWYDNDLLFNSNDYNNPEMIDGLNWSKLAICNLILDEAIIEKLNK